MSTAPPRLVRDKPATDEELANFEEDQRQRDADLAESDRRREQARLRVVERTKERMKRLYGSEEVPGWMEYRQDEEFSLSAMLSRFVFLTDGKRVCDLEHPRLALPLDHFKTLTATSRVDPRNREVNIVGGGDMRGTMPAADAWRDHPNRINCWSQTFLPGAPRITLDPEGRSAVNLWTDPPEYAKVPDAATIAAPFFQHVAYLLPDAQNCGHLLDWSADLLQFPGDLPRFHPLMVARRQGVGRNWFAEVLFRLVPPGTYAPNFQLERMLERGFNGGLSGKILAVVDEIRVGGPNRWKHSEALKSELTQPVRSVNPKYGREYLEFNRCRWLFLSNHLDAMFLTEEDRRILPMENALEPRGDDYYAALYAMLEDRRFIDAVRWELLCRPVTDFKRIGRAPMTDLKRLMIEASKSDASALLEQLILDHPAELITGPTLRELLSDLQHDGVGGQESRQIEDGPLRAVCSEYGVIPVGRFDLGKKRNVKVYALRNLIQWQTLAAQRPRIAGLRDLVVTELAKAKDIESWSTS